MYEFFLFLHSWLRWIVLIVAVIAIYKSYIGWRNSSPYGKTDNNLSISFVSSMHLMLLIGLVLYFFLSPITSSAWGSEVSAMKNASIRYWAVEHVFVMVIAVVFATIGRAKAKKKGEDKAKFKTQLIWFSLALVFMLSRIPWGEAERLFRF